MLRRTAHPFWGKVEQRLQDDGKAATLAGDTDAATAYFDELRRRLRGKRRSWERRAANWFQTKKFYSVNKHP